MSSTKDTILAGAQWVDDALVKIQAMTSIGGPMAASALKAAGMMIGVLREGIAGNVDPDTTLKELDMLTASIADNDQAADDALDAKFPKG